MLKHIRILLVLTLLLFCSFFLFSKPVHASYDCQYCTGWWQVERYDAGAPGELGGLGSYIKAEDMFAGVWVPYPGSTPYRGTLKYNIWLIDHGNGSAGCQGHPGEHSDYIQVGLENDGSRDGGAFFNWADCRPGSVLYNHPGPWIPTNDYGYPMNVSIVQTYTSGQWKIHYDDNFGNNINKININSFSTNNTMTPYAWRYGGWLYGSSGAWTNGRIHFTNNSYCNWNSCTGSFPAIYYGSLINQYDDHIVTNFPLTAQWNVFPDQSTTGGDLESWIQNN